MRIPAKYRIATAEQSQQVDADTIDNFGIGGFTLMEIAGSSAAKVLAEEYKPGSHGVFFCGKGNNGGDALVAARYLAQHDFKITVVFIAETDDLSPSADQNYRLLQSIAQHDNQVNIDIHSSWREFDTDMDSDFIIDGMLGTGLDSELRGRFTDAVKWANRQPAPAFAMDIPTGIHANTGQIMGDAIRASRTFAFGLLKQGYYLGPGKTFTGDVHFCELPFPNYLSTNCSSYLMDEKWLADQTSEPARHKYEAGVVYIIAGSEGLTGAAIMAAKSAWAEGVGAVMLVCPRGILSVFENNLPQIIKKPVGSHDDVHFKAEHLNAVLDIVQAKEGSVLMGPGMGRNESTVTFVNNFLRSSPHDTVIDADGLFALARQSEWKKPDSASWILTPHPGELSTLLGTNIEEDSDRLSEVKEMASRQDITLLSKGYPAMVGTPEGTTYITGYDTRIFSRAGFGDILAGKIVAFNALQNKPAESCVKALLHGKAKALNTQLHNKRKVEPLDLV